MKYINTFSLVLLACLSQQLKAIELDTGFYISPNIAYQDFGGNILGDGFNLEAGGAAGLAIGYQIDSQWGFEFAYHNSETEVVNALIDTDSEYFHFDGLYHVADNNNNQWSHYYVGGVGIQSYSSSVYDESDTTINGGAGIEYLIDSNFYVRSDVRGTFGMGDADAGALFNLGFAYIFNQETMQRKSKARKERQKQQALLEEEAAQSSPEDPDNDLDKDGVMNSLDQCPDTAENAKVDAQGCYVELEEEKNFKLNVSFKPGSSTIEKSSTAGINELGEFLIAYPQTQVDIEGHSDSIGSDMGNKVLSQKRADAVKNYLESNFTIESSRIRAIGYGEEKPIADNSTPEGRAANRRVVAIVKQASE